MAKINKSAESEETKAEDAERFVTSAREAAGELERRKQVSAKMQKLWKALTTLTKEENDQRTQFNTSNQ